jgi:hypothetical protein
MRTVVDHYRRGVPATEASQEYRIFLGPDLDDDAIVLVSPSSRRNVYPYDSRPREELRPHAQRSAFGYTDFDQVEFSIAKMPKSTLVVPKVIMHERRFISSFHRPD